MPDAVINHTSKGWPILDRDNYVRVMPDYTVELATKLNNSDADVAAAINAARDAQIAAAAVPRIAAGRWSGQLTAAAGAYASVSVPFPTGRFTEAPYVTATVSSVASGNARLIVKATGVTTARVLLYVFAADGSAISAASSIDWQAIQ